jgi:nicotinate-nucleotide pyrophosphorylase (carboxylating)
MRHGRVVRLTAKETSDAVRRALVEDLGAGDVTTRAVVPAGAQAHARVVAREPLTLAGLVFAEVAFRTLSPCVRLQREAADGDRVRGGGVLLTVTGPARALLSAERVALNFLQRLSGVATLTARYVAAVAGTRARILDTRKTTPGWRRFEKYAVACGGGTNHRLGLFDQVLIKDNHLATLGARHRDPVAVAVRRARAAGPRLKVEVEADTLTQVRQAGASRADIILLDNMPPATLRRAVALVQGRAITEASGGVNLQTVRAIAETGVDFISVGALTHSAPAVDIALDFEPAQPPGRARGGRKR